MLQQLSVPFLPFTQNNVSISSSVLLSFATNPTTNYAAPTTLAHFFAFVIAFAVGRLCQ